MTKKGVASLGIKDRQVEAKMAEIGKPERVVRREREVEPIVTPSVTPSEPMTQPEPVKIG